MCPSFEYHDPPSVTEAEINRVNRYLNEAQRSIEKHGDEVLSSDFNPNLIIDPAYTPILKRGEKLGLTRIP